MKHIFLIAALLLTLVVAHAQKYGTNPTTIGANTNFEVEATNGNKVSISKDLGKLTLKDGTEGAGKVLISDANGLSSWTNLNIPASQSGSTSVVLNGTSFERAALTGDVTALQNNNLTTVSGIQGRPVASSSPSVGQTLVWNGTSWTPNNVSVNTLYNADGSLSGNRTVNLLNNTLSFTSTATSGTNHFSVDGGTFNVDAVNNRVGVGYSAPTHPLHVRGGVKFDVVGGAAAEGYLTFGMQNFPNLANARIAYRAFQGSSVSNILGFDVHNGLTSSTGLQDSLSRVLVVNGTGRVGVNIIRVPEASFHVVGRPGAIPGIFETYQNFNSQVFFRTANGTEQNPTPVINNQSLGALTFQSYTGSSFQTSASFEVRASSDQTPTSLGSRIALRTTNDGETVNKVRFEINENDIKLYPARGFDPGTIFIGRSDANNIRRHRIITQHTQAASTNYINFQLHNGLGQNLDSVFNILTLRGNRLIEMGSITDSVNLDVFGSTRLRSLQDGIASDFVVTSDANGNLRKIAQSGLMVNNLYTSDGLLSSNRIVNQGNRTLAFTSSATSGTNHFSVFGDKLSVNAVNGRVGLGTNNPLASLHIEQLGGSASQVLVRNSGSTGTGGDNAGLNIQSLNRNADLGIISGETNETRLTFGRTNGSGTLLRNAARGLDIITNFISGSSPGAIALTVDTLQRVGIGTITPTSTAQINGTLALNTATSGTDRSVVLLSTGAFTPPSANLMPGRIYIIRNTSDVSDVTVSNIINYASTTENSFTLTPSIGSITIISNGTSWFRIN